MVPWGCAPSTDFVQVIKSLRLTAIIGVSTKGQGLHPRGGLGDGRAEPAAGDLRPVQPHRSRQVHRGGGPHLVWRPGAVRRRGAVPAGPAGGQDVRHRAGQQPLHLSRARPGHLRHRATQVADELFITAATAVAGQVTQAELDSGLLYPPQSNILQTDFATAVRVCEVIFDRGLAGVQRPTDIRAFVEA